MERPAEHAEGGVRAACGRGPVHGSSPRIYVCTATWRRCRPDPHPHMRNSFEQHLQRATWRT